MKTTPSLLAVITVTIFVGCSTTSRHRDFSGIPATDFTVSVTCGEPSLGFTGTIVSDGHTEHLSGIGKGIFHTSGHEITCAFKKSEPRGRISLSISKTGGDHIGDAITDETNGGVRAELLYAPDQRRTLFTSFR